MKMTGILMRLLAASSCLPVATALAGEAVAGRATFTVDPPVAVQIGPAQDKHMLVLGTSKGTNTNVGSGGPFDGSNMLSTAVCDLVRRSGTCHGYNRVVFKDGDSTVLKYSGIVQAASEAGDDPAGITFRGAWAYVGGTGKYASIKGGGVYQGRYVSETEYVVEWTGEVQ